MIWSLVALVALVRIRWQRQIAREVVSTRLCLQCGYRLLEVPTDEHGDGRCPECGRTFNAAWYAPEQS